MKTPIAINIGLNTTHGTRLDVHTATFQASRLGQIIASRVTDSPAGSEQTLALSILASGTRETFDAALYFIAQSLSQDCISCYDGAEGKLIGPNAEAWGTFEPAYFVNPATGRALTDEWRDVADAAGLVVDETSRLDIGSLPHQGSGGVIDGWRNADQFTTYLRETLIPDLKASGFECTAQDFETAAKFIQRLVDATDDVGNSADDTGCEFCSVVDNSTLNRLFSSAGFPVTLRESPEDESPE